MAGVPGYVRRYTRILRALQVLSYYPDGLPMSQLAEELGVEPDELRAEILTYYTAQPAAASVYTLPGIGWVTPNGEDEDPWTAEVVVLTDPKALEDLGVVRMSTREMAEVWRAGRILAEYEPENQTLKDALDVLADGWLAGPRAEQDPASAMVAVLRKAKSEQRRVRFRYAREWEPGISTRTVDPYRLIHTNRGWELDAGPLDEEGNSRTFLLHNISEVEVLDQSFEMPQEVKAILDRNRARVEVELSLPQRSAWGADTQADRIEVVRSDPDTVTLLVELSPPYARRLALILAPTMGEGMLMSHRDLAPAVQEVAHRLSAHHGFPLP
jgi:proteasome accessory factor C